MYYINHEIHSPFILLSDLFNSDFVFGASLYRKYIIFMKNIRIFFVVINRGTLIIVCDVEVLYQLPDVGGNFYTYPKIILSQEPR